MTPALATAARAPRALRGFAGVHRFFDPNLSVWTAQVLPGEYYVTPHDEMITTVLGSCVSVCMRDPVLEIGGMNHFLLPGDDGVVRPDALRYGQVALERLINELVKHGAQRDRLEIKLAGGGRVIGVDTDVGRSNIEFVHRYLHEEQLPIASESLGGNVARRVKYFPRTGRAQVLLMDMTDAARSEREARARLAAQAKAQSEVELF